MATAKHTAEPWYGDTSTSDNFADIYADEGLVATVPFSAKSALNARRIVACVNACAGIPTEALEAGTLRAAREALDQYTTALHAFAIERPHATVRELSSYLAAKGAPAAAMAALAKLRGEG